MVYIPQDLEILQILYQYDRKNIGMQSKYLESLLNKLTFEEVVYLYTMLLSLYEVIRTQLLNLESTMELPTADDHFMDFCYYCLSLPRERIYSIIKNPCDELNRYRIYYVMLSGKSTYEDEGFLLYQIGGYLNKISGHDMSIRITYDQAINFLKEYQDILVGTLTFPKSAYATSGCTKNRNIRNSDVFYMG